MQGRTGQDRAGRDGFRVLDKAELHSAFLPGGGVSGLLLGKSMTKVCQVSEEGYRYIYEPTDTLAPRVFKYIPLRKLEWQIG